MKSVKCKEAWFVQHAELYIHIYHQALLANKKQLLPPNIPMDSNCQLKNESPFTIYWCHGSKKYTQTFHWYIYMTNVYFVCFILILDRKMPSVSAFEGDGRIRIWTSEARLSIDPCRGDVSGKALWKKIVYCFCWFLYGSRHLFFFGRCVLFIEVIFGSEKHVH